MRIKFVDLVLVASFALLPFTKLALVDVGYLPLSAFVVFPLGFLVVLLKYRELPIDIFILLCMLFYLITITIFRSSEHLSGLRFLRELTPIVVGFGSYIFIRCAVSRENIRFLVRAILITNSIVLAWGTIELMCIVGILPYEIKIAVSEIITGSSVSRLQLTAPEASWAGMYLAFTYPYVLFYQERFKTVTLTIMIILFLATFSLFAYAICAIGYPIYIFISNWRKSSFFIKIIPLVVVGVLLSVTVAQFWRLESGFALYGYHQDRIFDALSVDNIESLVAVDGSFFIRIMYPIYGAILGANSVFGVGFVDYPIIFNREITNLPYGDIATNFGEVRGDIDTETADPRSFFVSFLAYGGVPIFLCLIAFIIKSLKKISINSNPREKSFLLMQACFALVMCSQFGSIAFFYFWVALALPHCLADSSKQRTLYA